MLSMTWDVCLICNKVFVLATSHCHLPHQVVIGAINYVEDVHYKKTSIMDFI